MGCREHTSPGKARRYASEFEELIGNDPVLLEYQTRSDEERYKILGSTNAGRILIAVWTARKGKVRAVTAYRAGRVHEELYWKSRE